MGDAVRGGEGRGEDLGARGPLYPTNSNIGGRTRGGSSARDSCNLAPSFEGEMELRSWVCGGCLCGDSGHAGGSGECSGAAVSFY
jgi:hypothetical protein